MAKSTVTQEEFEAGLSEEGGFSGLRNAGKVRDSPFGSAKVLPKRAGTRKKSSTRSSTGDDGKGPEPAAQASPQVVDEAAPPKNEQLQNPVRRRFKDASLEQVPFSFRGEYRDKAVSLARSIQRRKSGLPGDRFSACTLYRVFAEIGLDHFDWREGDLVRTEGELKELVRHRLGIGLNE